VTDIVLLAALVLIALVIYIALRTKSSASDKQKDHLTGEISNAVLSQDPGSDAFDAAFEKHIASHTNKCEPMEVLRLELDPNNPVDPNAIAVKRVDGSQLGYLESRIASELHRDAGKPMSWSAIFKHANRHPSTDEVVGAVIVLTRSDLGPGDS
jgi:hypothetical protein